MPACQFRPMQESINPLGVISSWMIHPTKTLIVFLDGAAEGPVPELGDMTPLESAAKPFMDTIASNGIVGCSDARAYTHLFTLEFLGGQARDVPRGVIEMLGHGVPLAPCETAYRLSPARLNDHTVEWDYLIPPPDQERLKQLARDRIGLIRHLNPSLYFYGEGKGLLKVTSPNSQTLPMPPAPSHLDDGALGELDPFISAIRKENRGLVPMPWGGGSLVDEPDRAPLPHARGLSVISKSPSVLGVAAYFGIEASEVDGYKEGFQKALLRLKASSVIWHIEETDDVSHKRLPRRKVEIIEDVDRLLSSRRNELRDSNVAFIVDHGTSSVNGDHLLMKVPFAIGRAVERGSKTRSFCETTKGFVPISRLLENLLRGEAI